jgi:DNA-binding response OmpR family regulator
MQPPQVGFVLYLSRRKELALPKILVIDDDFEVRDLISCILRMRGYRVVVAEDGIKGVAMNRAELPDLIITDMVMPEQGGAETIVRIRQETPDARIIAISGGRMFVGSRPLMVAKQLGVTETLQKPFMMTELIDCVTRTLSGMPQQQPTPAKTQGAADTGT